MKIQKNTAITDEILVAYLDLQLADAEAARVKGAIAASHDLQQRVAHLEAGSLPFAEAFCSLLDHPPPALRQRVDQMVAAHSSEQSNAQLRWRPDRRAILATGTIAFVAAALGYWTGRSTAPDMNNWREAVAQYHKLYSDKTLELVADSAAVADDALGRTTRALGLPISRAALEIPGLTYKRAQLLQIDENPLAQISFVTQRGKPLAFCIRRIGGAAASPQFESRAGLSVVHWLHGGFGFLIVADMDGPELQRLAAAFLERVRDADVS
jgi:anti-sigma factor RsiW